MAKTNTYIYKAVDRIDAFASPSAGGDSTPHDDEIKDALIAYEAAVYEDNSDEESIEPARNALLAVLKRCRDCALPSASGDSKEKP